MINIMNIQKEQILCSAMFKLKLKQWSINLILHNKYNPLTYKCKKFKSDYQSFKTR